MVGSFRALLGSSRVKGFRGVLDNQLSFIILRKRERDFPDGARVEVKIGIERFVYRIYIHKRV